VRSPDRFIAVRAGIINLYEYDEQVFELADGRLLLRGHNTSGKTKALELLLPFCLDGDISPRKLDPFAKSAKEMKWNLVGCVESEQRIGYVWLEFARLGGQGLEYVTAGIGMKANRGRDGVQRWYFLLRGRRVGHGLALRRGAYPLTRRELLELLAEGDELLGSPSDYRRRLNDLVYGFPSVEQYETMISLLLELRRPHLSKALNARDVAALLSGSLPEIDHDLMRRLGEGLEQLDDLQAALRTLESVRERVDQFGRSAYRAYARAVIAERGEQLRRAATSYGNASTARREADYGLDQARTQASAAAQALQQARVERDAAEGEREALLQSAEWASVAEVEQLGRAAGHARVAAERARERADDAAARLSADEADAIASGAAAEQARSALSRALTGLAADAAASGLGARHATIAAGFEDRARAPATVGELLHDESARWLLVLEEHERLLDALATSSSQYAQARAARDDAAAVLRAAGERRGAFEAQLEDAREALVHAIEAWAGELEELRLDSDVLARTLELAGDVGAGASAAPLMAWEGELAKSRDALVSERSRLQLERGAVAGEADELTAAHARLDAEQDETPPPAYTRPAVRTGRPGAPLWELVDFAPALTAAERAGIEAALEGAALLDAWVVPDETVLDSDTLDVVLEPTVQISDGATLAEVLVATEGGQVEPAIVDRILAAVALVDEPSGKTECAVSRDGRFRLGPAHGRFGKPAAEYIGVAARAERRARRIAELDGELEALAARDDGLARRLGGVEERLFALAADAARFPETTAVADARRGLAAADQREREARAELAEDEEAAAAAAERRAHAQDVRAGHAESCGLPSDLDLHAVRARHTAVHRYQAGIDGAVQAAARCSEAADRLEALDRRLAAARAAAAELTRVVEVADADARRLEAEHTGREAALGRTGAEIRVRMRAAETRVNHLRTEIVRLEAGDKAAAVEVKAREGDAERATETLAAAAQERETALDAFRRLGRNDVFALGLEDDAPPDAADALEWTLTRALEVLRRIPPARLAVRSNLVDLANRVQQQCSELDRALGQQADMGVVAEHDADGLVVVRVRQGAHELTVPQLIARMDDEIAARERTLSAEQRRIFNDTLLEEIAEHLRERIERVAELVADMNATLGRCPTGAGKTVQLDWGAREDGGGELHTVTRLLRRSVATLGEADRAPLIAFFRERIQHAREEAAFGAGIGPGANGRDPRESGAAAHLRSAFDYRDWFAFTLYEVKDGQRSKLTAKRHALGSGGEQAVLIHMPLFAAAAALYGSSHNGRAPRLVMLDEALSGIDEETREKVLAVLVALDLDIVMTSHELWGTYRTVPALSIYQLHRENGALGVACEHFLWDGESLRELEQTSAHA
jgi:uncharacterized protein (TIGR02680 family)